MLSRIFKVVNNKETSKCGENTNDTLAFGLCASSFLFLPNFDVACGLLQSEQTRSNMESI